MKNIHTPILVEMGANYPELVDKFGNVIATLHTTDGAEIVAAVNNHQSLLEALQQVRGILSEEDWQERAPKTHAQILDALTKAGAL